MRTALLGNQDGGARPALKNGDGQAPDAGMQPDADTATDGRSASDVGGAGGAGGSAAAGTGGGGGRATSDGSSGGSGAGRDGGTEGPPSPVTCPSVADGASPPAPPPAPVARAATLLPFSCNPLPRTFIFPDAAADPSAPYSRCATFASSGTTAVALSPDGHLAALINRDGVARVVDVASQQVIAVLAPPRGRVSGVAFSPSGDAALTIAGGEHQATLWRAGGWAPAWTVTLPGHTYQYTDGYRGAIAFSPDGASVVVSPGTDLFLLDVATGALRASNPTGVILDAAFAWGGRRVVVANAILTGHCVKSTVGGRILSLDPDTLAIQATIKTWAGYSTDIVVPAFRASPTDDLVFTPSSTRDADRTVKAFKISDGSALAPTGMAALPLAFMPDGAGLLVTAADQLRLVRVTDGAVVASAPAAISNTSTIAVSRDGRAVAVGAAGPDLLHVWNVATDYLVGVCALSGADPGPLALSGDGRLAALAVGGDIQILRPEDGTVRAIVTGNGDPVYSMVLSPSGRYVAVEFGTAAANALLVIGTANNGLIADLSPQKLPGGYWAGFMFSPDERSLYAVAAASSPTANQLVRVDLDGKAPPATRALPLYSTVAGFSRGCPVIFSQLTGVWRSCDTCDEAPPIPATFAESASAAVVSPDGRFVATHDAGTVGSATLWNLPPDAQPLHVFARRADEVEAPQEVPYAVTLGGARVLTGAIPNNWACYDGPAFASRLQDAATGAILATLPPAPTSLAGDLTRIAYGTEIWCAAAE